MARLWGVALAVFLTAASVGAGDPAITAKRLSDVVKKVLVKYKATKIGKTTSPMFSLAMSIPVNPKSKVITFDVDKVIKADPPAKVKNFLDKCKVYTGTRMVEATVLKYPDAMEQCANEKVPWPYVKEECPNVDQWKDFKQCDKNKIQALKRTENHLADHAEYRVLKNLDVSKFNDDMKNSDLMLFICRKTPCVYRCTNETHPDNILSLLDRLTKWKKISYVFSDLYKSNRNATSTEVENESKQAVLALGAKLGLENVYRCDDEYKCYSCKSPNENEVNEKCFKEPPPTGSG